jgi:hypothetical protein
MHLKDQKCQKHNNLLNWLGNCSLAQQLSKNGREASNPYDFCQEHHWIETRQRVPVELVQILETKRIIN